MLSAHAGEPCPAMRSRRGQSARQPGQLGAARARSNRPLVADPVSDAAAIDGAIAAYLAKYWEDPTVHTQMEAFLRSHAIVEFAPDRAFGIIEREDEFAQSATRWRW